MNNNYPWVPVFQQIPRLAVQGFAQRRRVLMRTWRSASLHVSMDGQVFVEAIDRTYRTYLYWFDKAEIGSGQIELRPVMDFLLEYAK